MHMHMLETKVQRLLLVLAGTMLAAAVQASSLVHPAKLEPAGIDDYGIFYDRYEPSFYTGFAPRATEPGRLHLHMGRGNQLRITLVLSNESLARYPSNLLARYQTYRELIDTGRMELTQNGGFDVFEQTVNALALDARIARQGDQSPIQSREENLALLEALNPGRVFRIRMSIDALLQQWIEQLRPADRGKLSAARALALTNALLPTRLWISSLSTSDVSVLRHLVGLAPAGGQGTDAAFRDAYLALLAKVSNGIYPVDNDHLVFTEFTAIHPIGSVNAYVNHKGRKIPQYPTPGRRALTYHQRTRTVDHIPTVSVYSYLPWLPYMHVGSNLHNSFHSLWWRMYPEKVDFLPAALRSSPRALRSDGEAYKRIWLLSRGPMSHGCTHVNAGHISELREMLPTLPQAMDDVDVHINRSELFDVFDIDGDLTPEVMGVKYFVAYSLQKKQPHKLRAPIEREAFYDWLYGGELQYREDGGGWFENIKDGTFRARSAKVGHVYNGLSLYEADYEREKIQFYKLIDIPFARALRQVSDTRAFSVTN